MNSIAKERIFMPTWFACTLFISAFLLFSVQPLVAKMILPVYGGTPAVWNTCLVFFQLVLLAGYAYAHVTSQRLGRGRQIVLHLCVVFFGLVLSPALLGTMHLAPAMISLAHPAAGLLAILLLVIGIPFFVLSATAPLLQRWFTHTEHPGRQDPYFLYAASNGGSMLALLSYPFLVEPNLPLQRQALAWIVAYGLFALMLVACAFHVGRGTPRHERITDVSDGFSGRPPALRQHFYWLALAFVPSSLLYGVTTYLTTDIAAVPLLWVLPLALYLLTFILVFARRPPIRQETLLKVFPIVILAQTFFFTIQDMRPLWLLLSLHLLVFFLIALACHSELARSRPDADHLTNYYLWLSLGGVLGGAFNTLLAPLLFDRLLEYRIVLVASCLLTPLAPPPRDRLRLDFLDIWLPLVLFLLLVTLTPIVRANVDNPALQASLLYGLPAAICYAFLGNPLRFTLGVAALLVAGDTGGLDNHSQLLARTRNFFGVTSVIDVQDPEEPAAYFRKFVHGNTLHGMQRLDEDSEPERTPLSYYYHNGPIGQLFSTFAGPYVKQRVAVIGLGAGTLGGYAERGQAWTFFEIDPAVARLAQQYFTFLHDAEKRGATVSILLGDGRRLLQPMPDGHFDLLFADAFSSDAVPVHLLTREALELYLRKLAEHGILVFNVTNRCLDLEPVLARLAQESTLVARIGEEFPRDISDEDRKQGKTPSRWVALARTEGDLKGLADDSRWRSLRTSASVGAWTDDFSNLFSVFRWQPR